ncbi:hypothetical protein T484DRAFT_1767341, partial [Baffinella frigidus]
TNTLRRQLLGGRGGGRRGVAEFGGVGEDGGVVGAFPYFIPFFNGLSGGQKRGYTHLVDSSLDWGQALPALKSFMDVEALRERPGGGKLNFYVSYFGLGNPLYHNVRADSALIPSLLRR